MPCRFSTGNLLQQRDRQAGSPRCRIHPRTPRRPSRQTAHSPRHTITTISCAERDTTLLPGRKMPQNQRRRCPRGIWSRKRHLFLRRMGYLPPAGQKNAPNPARKVPQRHLEQKKASFPAQNGMPTAFRAGKCPKSCAEGTPEAFEAEKGIFSCSEWNTNRLPGRKMPQIRRGRCSRGIWSRKRHLFLREMGYHTPPRQENAPKPARKVLRRHSRQKKASFPAQNGIPPASRAGKCPKSCAEGAPEAFQAEKGGRICAERDTSRLSPAGQTQKKRPVQDRPPQITCLFKIKLVR